MKLCQGEIYRSHGNASRDWSKSMLEIHGAQHRPRILGMSLGVRGVARGREEAEKG